MSEKKAEYQESYKYIRKLSTFICDQPRPQVTGELLRIINGFDDTLMTLFNETEKQVFKLMEDENAKNGDSSKRETVKHAVRSGNTGL